MSLKVRTVGKNGVLQAHRGKLTVMDLPTRAELAAAGRLPEMCECESCLRIRGQHPMADLKEG